MCKECKEYKKYKSFDELPKELKLLMVAFMKYERLPTVN